MYIVLAKYDGIDHIVYDDTGRDPFLTESYQTAKDKRDYCERSYGEYDERPKYRVMRVTEVEHAAVCNTN